MNNIFSFNRFGKLLKKEFYEYFQKFGITMAVFLLFIVIAWGISLLFGDRGFGNDYRTTGIYMLTALVSLFAPFTIYGYANNRKNGIYYALLPASSFEKFLSMAFYTLIFTPILFVTCALALDSLLVTIKSPEYTEYIFSDFFSQEILHQFFNLIQYVSLFVLANMLFKKQKVVKALLSIFVISIIVGVISGKLVEVYGPGIFFNMDAINSGKLLITDGNSYMSLVMGREFAKELLAPWFWYFANILSVLIPVSALTGTYFKIKTQKY